MARYIDVDMNVSKYVTVWDCNCSEFGKQTVMAVDDLHYLPIADVAPRAEWIRVEERLPENDWGKHWKERKYYLVFTKPSGLMDVAVYGYKEHDWWIDGNSCVLDKKNYKEVTHWMPLPEPPMMKGE